MNRVSNRGAGEVAAEAIEVPAAAQQLALPTWRKSQLHAAPPVVLDDDGTPPLPPPRPTVLDAEHHSTAANQGLRSMQEQPPLA